MSSPRKQKPARTGAPQFKKYHTILGTPLRLVNRNDSAAQEHRTHTGPAGGRRSSDKNIRIQHLLWARLSAREQDVTVLVCRGLSDAEIGALLYLSVGTVKTYLQRVFYKMNVRNRRDLMLKFMGFDFPPVPPQS